MTRTKRRRFIIADDSDDDDDEIKTKFQRTTSLCSTISSNVDRNLVTQFENLSNEVLYEIFEYIDADDIYQSFFKLNKRFENLFINSSFSFQFHKFSMPRSIFEQYYTQILMPNRYRIQSLHLSDPFTVEYLFPMDDDISIYSKLQTLNLDSMKSEDLENLLYRLVSLPKLSSLSISLGHEQYKENIYNLIFQLPRLKSCKISFAEDFHFELIPPCDTTSTSIEHLILIGLFDITTINSILSCVPQVRRLSIKFSFKDYHSQAYSFTTVLNNLTHVSLTIDNIPFVYIESFIKKSFAHVKVFHLSSNNDVTYLYADEWERLIVSYMPYLHTFDFQYRYSIYSYNEHENKYKDLFKKFSSSFWYERQWFFTHEFYLDKYLNGMFYSIEPYRRKYFTLYNESNSDDEYECYGKTILKSIRHVIINDGRVMTTNSHKYFPNTSELSLCSNNRRLIFKWPDIEALNCIFPVTQLTKITLDLSYLRFHRLIRLLEMTPNVQTLIFNSIRINGANRLLLLPEGHTFRLVSNENQIKNLVFKGDCSMKLMKVFLKLCPKLQHITISPYSQSVISTIRYLLSKKVKTICHLYSLCVVRPTSAEIEKLKNIIKSTKFLKNHSIKIVNNDFYIWW